MEPVQLARSYRGFRIEGGAQSVYGESGAWHAVATVTLLTPQHTLIQVYRYENYESTDADAGLAAWFGLFLAQIAVDHFIPSTDYFLTPMHAAWAIDLVHRSAAEFMDREVRAAKLYEALDYMERTLDKAWLVKRYRNDLRGDYRNWRERREKQYRLQVAARGIRLACAAQIVERMNELATGYRQNKTKIARLRQALVMVRSTPGGWCRR